jgi:hypothetical protein
VVLEREEYNIRMLRHVTQSGTWKVYRSGYCMQRRDRNACKVFVGKPEGMENLEGKILKC